MLTTDPGTLKIRIIAFNALLRHTVRKRKKAARFLLPPRFGRLPFRETEKPPLFVPVFRDVKPVFIMSCRKCAPGIRSIVSYFSQSLAMASEGICHAPRGERLIHVA